MKRSIRWRDLIFYGFIFGLMLALALDSWGVWSIPWNFTAWAGGIVLLGIGGNIWAYWLENKKD